MLRRFIAAVAVAGTLVGAPVLAQPVTPPGDVLRGALYHGKLSLGLRTLEPAAQSGDQEAKFAIGVLRFFTAVEGLVQALHRHGLAAPETGPMGPVLGVPIPTNADPEPLDYEKFRSILEAFVAELDAARDVLLEAGEAGDYVVMLDPLQFRVDVDGDGRSDAVESVAGVIAQAFGDDPAVSPEGIRPDGTKDKAASQDPPASPEIGFDRADAIWLAGYSQVFAAQADYFLAHDFSELVAATFHRLFPRAGLPMQDYVRGSSLMMDPESDSAIADLVAAVHTLSWPVAEPDRLARVRQRLLSITQFSRLNWQAILAETDDVAELVPSPAQTPLPGIGAGPVTEEMVAAWHDTLDKVDLILDGELLVPHWRFRQGFDLEAYFETAVRTDLVMLMTGLDALPFLTDGPIADAETFAEAQRVFGDNFINYAFWFN